MPSERLGDDDADRTVNRRCFLATVGVTATVGIAGCSGGSDSGGTTDSGGSGGDSSGGGSGGGGSGGGGSGCPSSSISYTETTLSGADGQIATIDLPASAETQQTMGLSVDVPLGGETASFSLNASQTSQSMSDISELGTDQESTDKYDFAADGARSVTVTGDGEVPTSVTVYVPRDDGLLTLVVQPQTPVPCSDTVDAIVTRMVESFQPV